MLRQRPDADAINRELGRTVESHDFERPNDMEYLYRGDNPALALRQLLRVRPLILDCGTSLNLLTHKALLDALGDMRFNAYIKEACDGELSIHRQIAPRLPSSCIQYYRARHEQNENPLPAQLESGDRLFIQGPIESYAFHPASPENGFNVLADTRTPGAVALVGFVSVGSSINVRWSYPELRESLLRKYNSPLSLRDLKQLHASHRASSRETAPYSSRTYASAYQWLRQSQPEALLKALSQLENKNGDLDQETELYPPKADSIRGVLQHARVKPTLNFAQLTRAGNDYSTVVLNPAIAPERQFGNWIPGFETHLPHQRQIYAVMETFYQACTDAKSGFHGAILYGQAGTGKTMACNALLGKLEQEGHKIWKTDFHQGEALLSYEEMAQLLVLRETKGVEAHYDALEEKFKSAWERADILFIDDTNQKHDGLAYVSNAALRYARRTGKKILITSNSDPIHAFRSTLQFPVDSVTLRHIEGPDYRAARAWHHGVAPENDAVPEQLNGLAATANQKHMLRWLRALQAHPGHNGVAFYGPPGMGKTTALRAHFAAAASPTLWIEAHTLVEAIDLREKLAASDAKYLLIDDCNDPKGNARYQKVLFSLLNNETLSNKNGEPVRVVLVSNRQTWQALVDDTALSKEPLSPRMMSRYEGRFVSIALAPDHDFRQDGAQRGVIVKADAMLPQDGAVRFSLAEYREKRDVIIQVLGDLDKRRYQYGSDDGSDRSYRLCSLFADDELVWKTKNEELKVLQTDALQQIAQAPAIVLDMRGCEKIDRRYEPILQQVLDVMDAKPDYRVTIVADDPRETMAMLETLMTDVDGTGKYSSRLQRLAVTP